MKKLLIIILLVVLISASAWYYFEQHKKTSNEITLYGNIDIRDVQLSFRVSGRLMKMKVDEGDKVTKGELIATLDSEPYINHLKEAQGQVKALEAELTTAERNVVNYQTLYQKNAGTKDRYDRAVDNRDLTKAKLETAKAAVEIASINVEDTQLLAPSNGVILTRVQEPGAIVAIGQAVYDMAVEDPIWARAYVPEAQLSKVYPGMQAIVLTDSGQRYKAHIGFISPQAEFTPKTVETTQLRTDLVYRLRVIIDDKMPGIQQGMPVTIKLMPNHE